LLRGTPLSYWHPEEIMLESEISVDQSSIDRWALRFLPLVKHRLRKYKPSNRG
jgi:putative transposase